MGQVRTSDIGLAADGSVELYVPPNVIDVSPSLPDGAVMVEYGSQQSVPTGESFPSNVANSIVQFVAGSGTMTADNMVVWRTVTLTPLTRAAEPTP